MGGTGVPIDLAGEIDVNDGGGHHTLENSRLSALQVRKHLLFLLHCNFHYAVTAVTTDVLAVGAHVSRLLMSNLLHSKWTELFQLMHKE